MSLLQLQMGMPSRENCTRTLQGSRSASKCSQGFRQCKRGRGRFILSIPPSPIFELLRKPFWIATAVVVGLLRLTVLAVHWKETIWTPTNEKKDFCIAANGVGELSLKSDHAYYYQIHCQFHMTWASYCHLVVWTLQEMFIFYIVSVSVSLWVFLFFNSLPEAFCVNFALNGIHHGHTRRFMSPFKPLLSASHTIVRRPNKTN